MMLIQWFFNLIVQKHFWVFHKGIHSRRAVSALILARTVCLSYLQEHNKRSRFSSRNGHTCRILHGNNLIGSIPKEIGTLKHLKILDLGMNQLSGPIPSQIGDLVSVIKM